jgi:hypothetical protein
VLKSLKAYNTKEDAIGVLGSNSRGSVRNFSLRCRKAKSPISIVSGKNTLLRDTIIIAIIGEDSSTTQWLRDAHFSDNLAIDAKVLKLLAVRSEPTKGNSSRR